MGYPMTYPRVVLRNGLTGNYAESYGEQRTLRTLIAGDMRRLEHDMRDQRHLRAFAEKAGISDHQAWLVLTAFFTDLGMVARTEEWLAKPCWPNQVTDASE
jgi:hypothetical protein